MIRFLYIWFILITLCVSQPDTLGFKPLALSGSTGSIGGVLANLDTCIYTSILDKALFAHSSALASSLKIGVYSDDGDGVVDAGDLFIDSTLAVSSSAVEIVTFEFQIKAQINAGTAYWLVYLRTSSNPNLFSYYYTATRTVAYDNSVLVYSFPDNLDGFINEGTVSRFIKAQVITTAIPAEETSTTGKFQATFTPFTNIFTDF